LKFNDETHEACYGTELQCTKRRCLGRNCWIC